MNVKNFENIIDKDPSQKLILIIYDKEQYDQDIINNILKEEEYPFNFILDESSLAINSSVINQFDEIWTFGFVKNLPSYQIAIDCGADIWEMG